MKKFKKSFNGYNIQEVNDFVKDVTREYENMLNNLKRRDEEIENLKQKLIRYQNMETTLNKALLVAEDASTQIKKLARDESKGIVEDAKKNASRIVNEALLKATRLEEDAENLKRRIIIFKRKFRKDLETELENIEDITEEY